MSGSGWSLLLPPPTCQGYSPKSASTVVPAGVLGSVPESCFFLLIFLIFLTISEAAGSLSRAVSARSEDKTGMKTNQHIFSEKCFTTKVGVMSLLQEVQDVLVPYSALNTVGIPPATLSKLTELVLLLLLLLLLPDIPQEILATTEFIEVHGRQGWSWS